MSCVHIASYMNRDGCLGKYKGKTQSIKFKSLAKP